MTLWMVSMSAARASEAAGFDMIREIEMSVSVVGRNVTSLRVLFRSDLVSPRQTHQKLHTSFWRPDSFWRADPFSEYDYPRSKGPNTPIPPAVTNHHTSRCNPEIPIID